MSVEVNWQTTRPTIRERTKFMLNNVLFSDVKFVVRKSASDGELESMEVIPAHKFVLSIGSPVFEAMFHGELAETRDSIELPDCEYESLFELFRYVYSDEVNLSGSNVMGVLYLAKKYIVPTLVEKCTEYLQHHLDPFNVLSILPIAEKYEEKNLVDRCWKVIDEQAEATVKSEGFATIERSLLEALVVRDTLSIREVDLFQAVDLWAVKECEKQGLSPSCGEQKRRILGEPIIKAIRFPVMKQEEFAAVVLQKNILTPDEVIRFFQYFSLTLRTPVGFSETKRSWVSHDFLRCGRFRYVAADSCSYDGRKDFLIFTVNKNVMLHGLCLCGSENKSYAVTLEVKELKEIGRHDSTVVSKTGTFSSQLLQYRSSNYYGFEVLFDSSVNLRRNVRYRIEALIAGPDSWSGCSGMSTAESSGVEFSFFSSCCVGNLTNQEGGQFPEFLFSLEV